MFGFGLQLPLPDTATKRVWHSLSAIQLSPHNVLLVAFGGVKSLGSDKLSDTVIIELSEYMYCSINSDSVTHYTVVLAMVYCRHITTPLSMQSREEMVSGWWGGEEQPWKTRGSISRCCQREG